MYRVPDNIRAVNISSWKVAKRYLWYCFIGLWLFNIPYIVLIEGTMAIPVLFLAQWIYFGPIFGISTLLNYMLLRTIHIRNDSPAQSYQRMIVWGILSGLVIFMVIWSIDRLYNFTYIDWWYVLSIVVSILSGHFALGGLLSLEQRPFPHIEWWGISAFAGIALVFFYVTEQVRWLERLLR